MREAVHLYVYVCMYVRICVCMSVCMYVRIYVCMFVYMYICVCELSHSVITLTA